LPLRPHDDGGSTAHASLCGFVLSFAGPHVPSFAPDCFNAAVHARHKPLHAVSQQTPSVQCPVVQTRQPLDLQSVAAHVAPCVLRATQVPFAAQ
jgi:hypothetical protein